MSNLEGTVHINMRGLVKHIFWGLIALVTVSPVFGQNATVTVNTDPGAMVYMRAPSGAIVDSMLATTGQAIFNNVTSVKDDVLPTSFDLSQNYPNPFAGESSVNVATSKAGDINVVVYNILAQELLKASQQVRGAGNYRFDFGIGDIASQVLFYKVEFEGESYINKMTYFSSGSGNYFVFSGTTSSFDGIFAGMRKENGITSGANYTFIAVKSGKAALNQTEWIDGDKTIEMPLEDGITVSGVTRGVDSDPAHEIYPLSNATVSLDGAVVNTASDGRYWIGGQKFAGNWEVLTISHPSHHNRTEYVNMGADTTMSSNISFDINEDLDFFDYINRRGSYDFAPALAKPDPARGDTLTMRLDSDYPNDWYATHIPAVMENEVVTSTGGRYHMVLTDDPNAYGVIEFDPSLGGTGSINFYFNDSNDPTKITNVLIRFKNQIPSEETAKWITVKELTTLFDSRDFYDQTVPEYYKNSIYYQGFGFTPMTFLPEMDEKNNIIAAKIGKLDITYKKNVE